MYDMKSVKEMLDKEKKLKELLYSLNKELEILKYEFQELRKQNEITMKRYEELKQKLRSPAML